MAPRTSGLFTLLLARDAVLEGQDPVSRAITAATASGRSTSCARPARARARTLSRSRTRSAPGTSGHARVHRPSARRRASRPPSCEHATDPHPPAPPATSSPAGSGLRGSVAVARDDVRESLPADRSASSSRPVGFAGLLVEHRERARVEASCQHLHDTRSWTTRGCHQPRVAQRDEAREGVVQRLPARGAPRAGGARARARASPTMADDPAVVSVCAP